MTEIIVKTDREHLESGVVLFRHMLNTAIGRGESVEERSADIMKQFIALDADKEPPEFDLWAIRVLTELSKDPEPVGTYARLVKEKIIVDASLGPDSD